MRLPRRRRTDLVLPFLAALLVLVVALSPARALPADQPFASYWFPNDLLTWSPATDPDSPYNRSHTPLRNRFLNEIQVNPHARANEARICPLDIFWATSGNPSQGSLDVDYFAFHYWQYIDVMVFWGGSAGEGLILAPNPGVIDAAHRNGVPVLGTIFFPPVAFGGNIQWVQDLVQQFGATFPVADKLIEVAEYYGFDGYFLNQETAGGNAALATKMIAFMQYFQANSDLQLMWYDAMTESGAIAWQEQLNSVNDGFFQNGGGVVSENMFLDFGWNATDLTTSRTNAQALGRSEFDLRAGIDVQANGYNTFVNWGAVFPEGQPHVTSLGLYVPSWTYYSSTGLQDFYTRSSRFWVGANRDPSNTTTGAAWKGMAHYVPAQSVIDDFPFVTNFCTGQGYDYWVDGQKLSPPAWTATGWNNLALQDLLPTWRWIVKTTGAALYPDFDWSDAYTGGNCLKVTGALTSDNLLQLYETDLAVSGTTSARVVYKAAAAGPTQLQLAVAYDSAPGTFVTYNVGSAPSADWNTAVFSLSGHAGDRILALGLRFVANGQSNYAMKIGRIAVENGPLAPPAPATNVVVERRTDEDDFVTLRLRWDHSPSNPTYYNVYRYNLDQSRTYLGGTPNDAYFVQHVPLVAGDSLVTIAVEAVGADFAVSSHATTTFLANPPPDPATHPDPGNGTAGVPRNPILSWTPGARATSHDVHFGSQSPPAFVQNQATTSFDPGDLNALTTYYWRIDEVNDMGITTGTEWSFTTGTTFVDSTAFALDFDGSNDFVDCDNGTSIRVTGPQITIEAVIRAESWRTNVWEGSIVNKEQNSGGDRGYMLRAGANGRLSFNLGSGAWHEIISPAGSMTAGTFHHVAGTYDGATMRLFIDGNQVASSSTVFALADANVDLYVGNSQSNPTRVFNGVIDEVRIWNRTRTQQQIQSLMNSELPQVYWATPDSGVVGYWRFNEGTGQTAADLTPHNNDARLGSTSGGDPDDPAWLQVQDLSVDVDDSGIDAAHPLRFAVLPNRPNPFRFETQIRFDLPDAAPVDLVVYDTLGRSVKTLVRGLTEAGSHVVEWDGRDEAGRVVASGVYFVRMRSEGREMSRKIVRLH